MRAAQAPSEAAKVSAMPGDSSCAVAEPTAPAAGAPASPSGAAAAAAPPAGASPTGAGDGSDDEGPGPSQKQAPTPCDVCGDAPHKYRCPGCGVRCCGLPCVQRHKADSGCTGKRDRFAFVPLTEFSDRELLSDYRWLEEVNRADDNARRHRPPAPRAQLPQALASLVHQAKLRGVRLLLMPPGMQRRRESTTFYDYRARKLLWRIEWAFPEADPVATAAAEAAAAAAAAAAEQEEAPSGAGPSGRGGQQQQQQQRRQPAQPPQRWAPRAQPKRARLDPGSGGADGGGGEAPGSRPDGRGLVIADARADEGTNLRSLLESHLADAPGAGARRLALRAYLEAAAARGGDLGSLPVLMRQEQCPANAPKYYRLDPDAPLGSQLAGKTVIEFPSLVVVLPGQEGGERYPLAPAPPLPPPPPPPPRRQQQHGQRGEGEQQQQQQQQQERQQQEEGQEDGDLLEGLEEEEEEQDQPQGEPAARAGAVAAPPKLPGPPSVAAAAGEDAGGPPVVAA